VADAYGGFPFDARMEGSVLSLGDFYSCVEIQEEDFEGNYCFVIDVSLASVLGMDGKDIAHAALNPIGKGNGLGLNVRHEMVLYQLTDLQSQFQLATLLEVASASPALALRKMSKRE